jgi:hypothetical protein
VTVKHSQTGSEDFEHQTDHARIIRRVNLPRTPGSPNRTDRALEHRNAPPQHGEHLVDRAQRRHPQQEGCVVIAKVVVIAHEAPEFARLGRVGDGVPDPNILEFAARLGAGLPQAPDLLRHHRRRGTMFIKAVRPGSDGFG